MPDIRQPRGQSDSLSAVSKGGTKEEKGKKFHKIERAYGKFVRRFSVPSEIDVNKLVAEFKDGVLHVRLPKVAVAKPKAIEVKVA